MNNKKRTFCKIRPAILCLLALLILSCSKDNAGEVPYLIQKVNRFVLSYSNTYYLWKDKVSYDNKNPKHIEDPFALFDELKYTDLDHWSYLTDNSDELFNSYNGIETTYGYSLVISKFSNSDRCFAIIKYIYAGSPAEKAGLKRGDLLIEMNGGNITTENYLNLYNSLSIELQVGTFSEEDNSIMVSDKKVSMTAVQLNIDAVNAYTVIEEGAHKVGYICYTDFVPTSHDKLSQICSEFKTKGVTDVVLDLRYNQGGASFSAEYLSSLFVPKEHLENKDLFLKEIWNEELLDYFKSRGEDVNTYFNLNALSYNMDLDRIFILTTPNTASASEATIVGMTPYMDVIKIGTATHGKYCGALLLHSLDKNGKVESDISNWAMSLVGYKFANKNNFTDFSAGIAPDYQVDDNLFATYPFGDKNDPHLAKALEIITGVSNNTERGSAFLHTKQGIPTGYQILEKETQNLNGNRGGMVQLNR